MRNRGQHQRIEPIATVTTIIATAFLFGSRASAQPERIRYERDSAPTAIDVKATEHSARLSGSALSNPRAAIKPALTSKQLIDAQPVLRPYRVAQREKLIALIRAMPKSDPDRSNAIFRLAESYASDYRFHTFAMFRAQEGLRSARGAVSVARLRRAADEHASGEKVSLTAAVRIYASLTRDPSAKTWPRMDEARYYYALLLRDAGKPALALTVFRQLLQSHPSSRFQPHALLALAEHEFDNGQLASAERLYRKVLQLPGSRLAGYALYKLGWVQLLGGEHKEALATFFKLANRTHPGRGSAPDRALHGAARKDFVRAYAEVGKVGTALAAFRRLEEGPGSKGGLDLLHILALVYFDSGKTRNAVFAFRELIRLQPDDERVCEWQGHIQQLMLTTSDKARIVRETTRLSELYTLLRRRKAIAATTLTECREAARGSTGELAKLFHQEANRTLDNATFAHSAALYELYLDHFGRLARKRRGDDVGVMQLYYADLLWAWAEREDDPRRASSRWERAAAAFTTTLEDGRLVLRQQRDAAHAAALAWKNALQVDPATPAVSPPSFDDEAVLPPKLPIERRRVAMIRALDQYVAAIGAPADPESVLAGFLKAREYWRHGHLTTALPLFADIVARHREHASAHTAAIIQLNLLIRLGRFAALEKLTAELLADKAFLADKDTLRDRLELIRSKIARKRAEKLAAARQWIACGEAYLALARDFPSSPQLDEVLYSAGHCFEQGASVGYAITMYRQLRERFPKSPHAQRALVRIGDALGKVAHYEAAAASYETFAREYAGEELAPQALSQAVAYRLGIGDDDKAIADTELYIRQYRGSQPTRAAEALFSMTAIFEKRGEPRRVIRNLERYLKEFGVAGGRARLIIAHARIGALLWQSSCRRPAEDGSCVTTAREKTLRRRHRLRPRRSVMPLRCGEEDRMVLTVNRRDAAMARRARAHLERAVAAWADKTPAIAEAVLPLAAHWAFSAKFHLVEADYEGYLDIAFPDSLDFDPSRPAVSARSARRFISWLKAKDGAGGRLNDRYREILRGKSAHWAIAAAARMGQLPQNLADGLYRAEVPSFVRTGPDAQERFDMFCGGLEERARPYEQRSIAAFQMCLNESTRRNWFDRWAGLCERELGSSSPQKHPPTHERHGIIDAVAPVVDTSPAVAELSP